MDTSGILIGSAGTTSTSGNDTFIAAETTAATWSLGDSINGGAGNDTLNVVQTAAIAAAAPTGATVTGVETVNYTGAAAITANVTPFTGVTLATATNSGANNVSLTGAATTDLTVTNSTLATATATISGGKNVTSTTGALLATAGTGGAITVTGASGAVNVTSSQTSAAVTDTNATTGGAISVTGGTTVNVTQNIAATAAAKVAMVTADATVTHTGGAITVTGDATTTSVTVTQTAANAAAKSATIGREAIVAGAVTVNDANRASTTAAGTIETVTLTNAGAATVNSGALKTLNLGGTLITVDAGTLGALTTAANSALSLNLNGAVSTGAVTIDSDIKTLNISGNTTASTINSLVASGATTINVSGDALVTLTGNTTGAVTAINVTNTAGAKFGTALGTTVGFTGGAGADSIILSDAFSKAITMGAGNDTVTYGGAASTTTGALGSVAAGEGNDTIIMTDAQAAAADGSSVFNTSFTGFETLQISDAFVTDDLDLDGVNAPSKVILATGATTATMNNLVSGGTVVFKDTNSTGTTTINVRSAVVGANDVLNLEISNTGDVYAAATITAANVETINISAFDANTKGSAAAINTMTLAATAAKTVTVSGNNGLTLTNTNNAAITLFDASGVVKNDTAASTYVAATTDSAANLAVTFASANTTAAANVSIKGGAGDDTLSGSVAKDTISGGAGIDTIYSDNAGAKQVGIITLATDATAGSVVNVSVGGVAFAHTAATGGLTPTALAAALVVKINADTTMNKLVVATSNAGAITFTSKTDGVVPLLITENDANTTVTPTAIDGANGTTVGVAGTTAVDVIDGGAGADFIVGGGGADTITTGAGADTVIVMKAHSVLSALATITDYTFVTGGSSNDKIILADVTSVIGTTATVQDLSSSATLAIAIGAAANTNTVDLGLSVFNWGGDTYAFVETTGATTTYVATDFVVKLTGLALVGGQTIAGTGFDAV